MSKIKRWLGAYRDLFPYLYTFLFLILSGVFLFFGSLLGMALALFTSLICFTYTPLALRILNKEEEKKVEKEEVIPEPIKTRNTKPKRKTISVKENIESTKPKEKREHLKLNYPTTVYPDKVVRASKAVVPKLESKFSLPKEDPNPQVLIFLLKSGAEVYHAQFLCMNSLTGEAHHHYSIKRWIPNFAKSDKGRTQTARWNAQWDAYKDDDFKVKVREYFNNFRSLNEKINVFPNATIICFKEDKDFVSKVLPTDISGICHEIQTIQDFMEVRTSHHLFPRGLNKLEVLKLFGVKRGVKGFFDPVNNLHLIWKSLRDII